MHPVRIGPYLIDRKIGAGAMGTVYLGTNEQTGQVAAVKVLPASLAREDGFVLRFNREIDALQRLSHKNIVKFFESGTDDNETYYYAMEYVDGENLTLRLRRERRIHWSDAIQIAIQICAGLKHAHDVGIVHRDLKPSNLLIGSDGTVKITDFGVAQVFAADQLTMTGAVIGTAEFMSPEQVEGRRADKRSDLYSLGTVLYTMVVGQPPFSKGTPPEIMQKQRFGVFDPPRNYVPEVPSWLDEIICQLLEKNPEKRLPDAFVLSRRLQEVVKKVELKNSEPPPALPSPEAETRLDKPVAAGRPLGATLVRELVRAQASRQQPESVVERLFNNTWVLVTMLVLVIGGLIWFWPSRDDGIGGNSSASGPRSEPERILQTARWQWKTGDGPGAKRQLESLRAVIADDERQQQTVRAVDKLLEAIRNQRPTFQRAFIRDALDRAAAIQKEDREKARAILNGIVFLYGNDRSLGSIVEDALKMLEADREASKADSQSTPDGPTNAVPDAVIPQQPAATKSPSSTDNDGAR